MSSRDVPLRKAARRCIRNSSGRFRAHRIAKVIKLRVARGTKPWEETPVETIDKPWRGTRYVAQVEEVHRCLRAGLAESPVMPLDETVALVRAKENAQALPLLASISAEHATDANLQVSLASTYRWRLTPNLPTIDDGGPWPSYASPSRSSASTTRS